ncbi:MAG: adenylate/guanylate cyclase domain-containing protein [Deltaproteobacteria bacterium]|jgi:class 3 adenylate cyclase|nr:adenylate/guanylate cyclase domain-containing protein [Deltaproteobacteria bacterium]MBW2530259.1 adenylate/guanylate cyclase domain-containing protein [Deltaproteobacteria bacterium]
MGKIADPVDPLHTDGLRQLLREFVTGIGAGRAPLRRLRLGGWLRLLLAFPLLLLPTVVGLRDGLSLGHARETATLIFWLYATQVGIYVLASAGILLMARRGSTTGARMLTYLCLTLEITTNQTSTYAVGALISNGALTVILLIAVYRVTLDFGLSLVAAALGAVAYLTVGLAEAAGAIPITPVFAYAVRHPFYEDPGYAAVVIQITLVSIFVTFAVVNYATNQAVKLHRYITNNVLRRHLPPALVERAARGELRLDAPPERRVVTVLFIDLVGFTPLSERLGPDAVGGILNRHLSLIADVAHHHGATVDKFVGDAAMLVFGAPEPLDPKEQAERCVALALAILRAIAAEEQEEPLRARIGINTGEAVMGNFGSANRSDFTVVGPAVNLAARLESAAQPGRVLIGPETARLLGDEVALEAAGLLQLKGVAAPVEAFHVLVDAE